LKPIFLRFEELGYYSEKEEGHKQVGMVQYSIIIVFLGA
jgi:hypothetical protein